METLQVGLKNELSFVVADTMTAKALLSGALDVFSTPSMIAWMEHCCATCVAPHLPEGSSTVGTTVDIAHLAATPVGMGVTVRCTLEEVDRRRLVFSVEAEDACEMIGRGRHERFIVDNAKFLQKCAQKGNA